MKKILSLIVCLIAAVAINAHAATKTSDQTGHHRSQQQAIYSGVVDLNKATAAQIASLKGIGPKKAEEVVKYRKQHGRFKSVDQLANLRGFSKTSVAKLQKENSGRLTTKAKS